ncbi:2-C-methyl-D-erythritol 4-phosphate cytidylyltransferase [Clostridium akagii]|uniref:2-C-methyl-D-erythritol 4-phosphate cytidylyltransferase n=1 Tax=Clostridium akagii TaxID=91623 RepID=UPI00047ACEFE|nr:2-C-methyl-D-erythritol 4-phosphate cytidylyltransferase [Clostridium akagii]
MNNNCAIVVAGGKGTRMKKSVNKLFLCLDNKPILAHTLEAFQKNKSIFSIILVASEDEIEYCEKEIVLKYSISKVKKIVSGGNLRQQSVLNGLKAIGIEDDCNIVLIHDGARPFIDDRIIEDGIKYANLYGASACGVEPKDTIKIRDNSGFSKYTPKRSELFCVQTPQCFKLDIILKAHENIIKKDVIVTDDTSVAELYGSKVFLYQGSYSNIKITTPDDLILGEKILDSLIIDSNKCVNKE